MNINEEENEVEENVKKGNNKNKVLVLLLGMLIGGVLEVFLSVTVLNKQSERMSTDIAVEQQELEGNVFEDDIVDTSDEEVPEEGFVIETPVVDLNYPEKWKDQVRVEQLEGDLYTVRFFAILEGKEEQHIFDVVFGKTDGLLLGTLEQTEIYLVYNEIAFDESWSEEESNEIYAMQEDVNCIIEMLQKEEGFVAAF